MSYQTIDKQYSDWLEKNPISSFEHIDTDHLRKTIIDDLSYVSKMDVKEYTLYQKWCEVKEKYPTRNFNTIFGVETQLVKKEQQKIIDKIKYNLWIPNDPDDFLKLKPVLIPANKDGAEIYNTTRNFIHTMKNNNNIGRNIFYVVNDEISGKHLGLICISSDFLDLSVRDRRIGWSNEIKTKNHMINHTAIGSTIVPVQPFGYNYVGGKLLALLCLSDKVQSDWKNIYGDTLVGVTTTSLYGSSKLNGLSQYDGLDHWDKMGFSNGSVNFKPNSNIINDIKKWLKINYTRKYFEWYSCINDTGGRYKRDPINRSLKFVYSKLKIPKELTESGHMRGIYFSSLYENTNEFLRKEIPEKDLIKSFPTDNEYLTNIWKTKYAKSRMRQLQKKNCLSKETLFYDDLIFLSWEETKSKYLSQVGR